MANTLQTISSRVVAVQLFYSALMMVVSPAFSLYNGLRESNPVFKKWLLVIFITFYGSIIQIAPGQDGAVHWARVYDHYVGMGFSQFIVELISILRLDPAPGIEEDAYIHVMSFLSGSFFGAPQFFFVFVSFVYGYFFSASLIKILPLTKEARYGWLFYGFAIVFVMWKSIEGINTVRTWTGLWILFYAFLSYYETRHWKYLVLLILPPLVHVGYFVMVLPAWIIVLLGRRTWIYTAIFLVSFVTSINDRSVVREMEQTRIGEDKVRGYYTEEIVDYEEKTQEVLAASTIHKKLYEIGVQNWGINLIALLLIFTGAAFYHMTKTESALFCAGLLMKALSNYSYFLYALSNRTSIIAGIFILAALILMWRRGHFRSPSLKFPKVQQALLVAAFVLCIPFLFFRIADMIYFISVFLFAFPFVPWISEDWNMSIREAIGSLL